MYKCKHFKIYELVDEATYYKYGDFAWSFFDDRILRVADFLRSEFGTCTVNNWFWDGNPQTNFTESGLRLPDHQYYSPYSMHTHGKALDMKFSRTSSEEIREWLRENWHEGLESEFFEIAPSITVERGVSWLHVDSRNSKSLYNEFNP